MKTKIKNQNTKGLLNRPEQSSTDKRPKIDLKLRRENRQLETESVLQLLQEKSPQFYELAEVVGKWVWITFTEKQPSEITSVLAELGFHWNNTRQSWQHPCGTIPDERADYDPRVKYGSYYPASESAA